MTKRKKETKLKPCPFCGSKMILVELSWVTEGWFVASCVECGASISDCQTMDLAKKVWNTRAK